MYKLIRPLLFNVSKDPETVHHLALSFLKLGGARPIENLLNFFTKVESESLKQKLFGLNFINPVGLAGGFDKNGEALKGLQALGFGFLEIGTITQHAQPGNNRPRIFRLTADEALINRMGFNNNGADALAKKLSQNKTNTKMVPIGINLGKTKITSLDKATDDYLYSFTKLYNFGDYFVINISSPNTPGLRQLVDKNFLIEIISSLKNYQLNQKIKKPIFLKITTDFSLTAIDEALEICKNHSIEAVICSNTSLGREGLTNPTNEAGGLSGKPIKNKATQTIKHIHKQMPDLPIIGVGGIFNAADAYEKIKAGASLVQIYTGLVYEGPGLIKKINQGLVALLKQDGFTNISQAVGTESKV